MLSTVTKKDIISLGFSPYQSQRVIREAKALLVERGATSIVVRKSLVFL